MNYRTLMVTALALAACKKEPTDDKSDDTTPITGDDTFDSAGGGADGNDTIEAAEDLTGFEMDKRTIYAINEEAYINPSGDRDFYALTLQAHQAYFIWTESYDEVSGDVPVDTVIRLYNADGQMIDENDDMMFRFRETDSGMWLYPLEEAIYYIEVLEFGDWDGSGASGGSSAEYALLILTMDPTEREGLNETPEAAYNNTAVDSGDTAEDDRPSIYLSSTVSNYAIEFSGQCQVEGDVDWWPIEIREEDPDDDGYTPEPYFFLSTSMWPDYAGLTPKMSLYDDMGNLLATTETPSPETETAIVWVQDAGLLVKVDEGRTYYAKVEGVGDTCDEDTFYPAVWFNYLSTAATVEADGDDNDDQITADLTYTQESDTTDGLYFIGVYGTLPADDSADWFKLLKDDVGGFDGKFISVVLQANTVGSALDAKVRVVDANGVELVSATVDEDEPLVIDPTIIDFEVIDDSNLFIVVEAEGRNGPDTACNYIAGVYVSEDELFADR